MFCATGLIPILCVIRVLADIRSKSSRECWWIDMYPRHIQSTSLPSEVTASRGDPASARLTWHERAYHDVASLRYSSYRRSEQSDSRVAGIQAAKADYSCGSHQQRNLLEVLHKVGKAEWPTDV
jgi:hypothetical protein